VEKGESANSRWAGLLRVRRKAGPAEGRMPARQSPAAGAAGGFNAVQKLLTNQESSQR